MALRRGLVEFAVDRGDEPVVFRQSEEEVHIIGLAPGHQFFPGEAAVGTQQNPHMRPPATNMADNARNFLHRTGRGINIGAAQLGDQQMAPTEDVKRQIADTMWAGGEGVAPSAL